MQDIITDWPWQDEPLLQDSTSQNQKTTQEKELDLAKDKKIDRLHHSNTNIPKKNIQTSQKKIYKHLKKIYKHKSFY